MNELYAAGGRRKEGVGARVQTTVSWRAAFCDALSSKPNRQATFIDCSSWNNSSATWEKASVSERSQKSGRGAERARKVDETRRGMGAALTRCVRNVHLRDC